MVIAPCVDVSQENIPHRIWISSLVCNVRQQHVVYPSLEGRISTNKPENWYDGFGWTGRNCFLLVRLVGMQ
jgi:hypothetical protein